MKTQEHFFISDTDGGLYDTRRANWHKGRALRIDYARHHREIVSGRELLSSLRAGAFAWPGGYALFYVTSDGACLCPACVRAELRNILASIKNRANDGWRVVGLESMGNLDDDGDYCAHCNKLLSEL